MGIHTVADWHRVDRKRAGVSVGLLSVRLLTTGMTAELAGCCHTRRVCCTRFIAGGAENHERNDPYQ